MFRKSIIALAAFATLAIAALPSDASAHRRHHRLGLYGLGAGLAIVGAGIYANTCQTVYEWRVNRRGVYYQVPVTYC